MVIAVMAALTGILVPVLSSVRVKAYDLLGMSHQRTLVTALNSFALDHGDRYPPSVSHYPDGGMDDPRRLTAIYPFTRQHRSVAAYLNEYAEDADAIHCPSAPDRFAYLEQMWQQGDDWRHPLDYVESPMTGHFSYFWNYQGLLWQNDRFTLFRGPSGPGLGGRQKGLLLCDSFVQGDQQVKPRPPDSFSSCQHIPNASASQSLRNVAPRWALEVETPIPNISLKAAYVDGHVERYQTREAVAMRVILKRSEKGGKLVPWPLGSASGSLGIYYLPPSVADPGSSY